jgi:hypothetical protein
MMAVAVEVASESRTLVLCSKLGVARSCDAMGVECAVVE